MINIESNNQLNSEENKSEYNDFRSNLNNN